MASRAVVVLLACLGLAQANLLAKYRNLLEAKPSAHRRSLCEAAQRRMGETVLISKDDPQVQEAWKAGLFDANSPAGAHKQIEDVTGILKGKIYLDVRPDSTVIPMNGTFVTEYHDADAGSQYGLALAGGAGSGGRQLQSPCDSMSVPSTAVSWSGGWPSSGSPTTWVINCKAGHYRAAGSFVCYVAQSCGNWCYDSCCSSYCCASSYRDWDGDRGDDIRSGCTSYCCSGCNSWCCSTSYSYYSYTAPDCQACVPPNDPNANNPSQVTGVATYSWSCRAGAYGSATTRTCDTVTGGWSGSASSCRLCSPPSVPNAVSPTVVIGTATYSWTCVAGYYGSPSARTCSSTDGSWSGSAITCNQCSPPGTTAAYSATTISPGILRYSCNPGYVGVSVTRTCDSVTGGWNNAPPVCNPVGVGYYSLGGGTTAIPCPAGTYGAPTDTTLTTAACSGMCAAGYFCPQQTARSAFHAACGSVDRYCPQGSGAPIIATTPGWYTTPLSSAANVRSGQATCPNDRSCFGGILYPAIDVSGCLDLSAADDAKNLVLGSTIVFTNLGCTSSNCGMSVKVDVAATTPGCSVDPSVTFSWVQPSSGSTGSPAVPTLSGKIQTGPNFLYGDRCTAGYKVTVTATRNADATLTGVCSFVVALQEINIAPQIDRSTSTGCPAIRSIDERSPVGKAVTGPVLKATDVNRGQAIMFSIVPLANQAAPPFSIGLCDGVISVSQANIDYSKQSSYTFNVVAKDTAASPLTDTCQVTIKVNDLNDAPTISNKAFQVPENTAAGFLIGNVGGTDPDAADIPRLTYSITRADSPDHIAIHSTTGDVTVKVAAINYEAKKSYTYEVTVTDGVNRTPTTIVIDVVDQVDPPVFTSAKVLVVNENSPAATVVRASIGATTLGMTATDEDIVNGVPETVSFYLDCPVTPSFVVSLAGEVTVATNAVLDFESRSSYACTATAKDARGGTTVMPLTINLVDINEQPIFRVSCPATLSINENSVQGAVVGGPVSAFDVDAGQVIAYTLTAVAPNTQPNLWSVDGLTGQIRLNVGSLDYEPGPRSYTMNIVATDSGANKLATTCAITVNVNDVNEQPVFRSAANGGAYTLYVDENSPVDTLVGTAAGNIATDPEGLAITYTLTGSSVFVVGSSTGQIKVAVASLDFEAQSSYSLVLTATDPAGNLATQAITIKLNDLQEPPKFVSPGSSITISVQEETPNGAFIGQPITAIDPDKNQVVRYSVAPANANQDYVAIDPNTGMLKVSAAALPAAATLSLFTVTVTATDNGVPPKFATMQVVCNITYAPVKNKAPYVYNNVTIVVPESTKPGTIIGDAALYAFDPDNDVSTGRFDALTFQLGNTNPIPFALASDGKITLSSALDFESMPWLENNYTLIASCTDSPPIIQGVQLVSLTTVRAWTIIIRDDNEPCTLAPVSVRLAENVPVGTAVLDAAGATLVLRAVDQDYHPPNYNESVKYTITSGNINKAFDLKPLGDATKTGAGQLEGVSLITAGPINYEKLSSYSVEVTATDARGLSCKGLVTLAVDDKNDVPTLVQPPPLSVAESTLAGSAMGGLYSAADEDGDSLSWQITAGNVGNVFTISPNGQLILAAAVDYETLSTYSLTIQVSDGRGGIASKVHAVTILDVAEAPVFSGPMAASINENSPQGTVIFTAVCKDQDFGDVLTYSITGGSNGVLQINPSTGAVSIQDATYFNFEVNAAISPQISCTDKTGLVAKQIVRVAINNLNERPQLLASTLFVTENSPSGTASTLPLAWFDEDIADTLSVSIVGGNFLTGSTTPLFSLSANGTMGTKPYLYTNAALFDYEGKKAPSKYIITLNITDNGSPQLYLVTQVTVAAVDVNEPPKFLDQVRSIAENSAKNAFVGAPLVAADEDAGQSLYFSIISGDPSGFFKVDCSGQITVASPGLDFEASPPQHPFSLVIEVTDDGGTVPGPARLATRATVTVTIVDQNEAPSANDMAVTVPENSPVGFKIADIGGSDPDVLAVNVAWRTLTYSLVSNPSMAFAINATTGVVSVGKVAPWDFESPDGNVLTAVISVTDGGGLAGTRLAKLVCTITDVNEKPAIQTTPKQVRFQRESTITPFSGVQTGTLVGQNLVATDPDDGQSARLVWAIMSSAPPALAAQWFSVDASGATAGQLKVTALGAVNGVLDYELYPTIDLLMRVTDEFGLFDEQNITIALVDLNENPAVWQAQTVSVFENSPAASPVGTSINATDPEKTALSYSLVSVTGPQGMFSIDSGSGQIRVLDPTNLDFEAPVNSFTAVVEVEDMGTLRDGSPAGAKLLGRGSVTINIMNVNEAPRVLPCVLIVPENSPVGTFVGSVAFSAGSNCMMDPDGSADAMTAVFNITAQDKTYKNEASPFVIDPVSGNITVAAVNGQRPDLNYEAQPTFKVWLTAKDAGGLLSAPAPITIKLSNVNEPPRWKTVPTFYAEDTVEQNVGLPLINFVEDEDLDVGSTGEKLEIYFAYFNAGNLQGTFTLDDMTGQLTAPLIVNPALKRGTIFNLTIQVFDKGVDGPMYNDTTIVRVVVTNSNKVPFLGNRVGGYVSFFIPENVVDGFTLGRRVNGTDPNADQQITYTLASALGNANRPWPFDIRTLPNLKVPGGLCAPINATTCANLANPSGLGEIFVKFEPGATSIDFEAPQKAAATGGIGFNVYDGIATGTDDHETHMQMSVPIKIFVQDMPEAPYFTNTRIPNTGVITMSIAENSAAGVAAAVVPSMSTMVASPEGGIFAVDEDAKEGHGTPQHLYSFVGSPTGQSFFTLDSRTGVITVNADGAAPGVLNWEAVKEFNFTVKVVDKTGRSDTALLRMQVADVNEAPYWIGSGLIDAAGAAVASGASVTVKENSLPGTAIARVMADDFDAKTSPWGKLVYSLQQDGEAVPFDINPATGALIVSRDVGNAALLDWEDKRRWTPVVVVTDGGDLFVKKNVTVDVLDVADSTITGFSVAPADEAAGKAVTVRTSSIYAVTHLGMDVLLTTEGGVTVTITGTNLGPTAASIARDGANIATTVVSATYGPSGVEFVASQCAVSVPNTAVTCRTTAAVGPNHVWKITISYTGATLPLNALSGANSAIATGTALTGVLKPVVDKIYVTDAGTTTPQDMPTNGGSLIFLEGSDFSSPAVNSEVTLFYGPVTGREYRVTNCIYLTDHKKVKCLSAPGVGTKLKFSLQIGSSPLQMTQVDSLKAATIRYSTPVITDLTAPRLDTAGGDTVAVVGQNFGPAGTDMALVCSSDLSAPKGVPVFTATKCTVLSHQAANCVTSPGIGGGLKCRASVGGQVSDPSAAQIHYRSPQITKLTGLGAAAGSTRGGQQLIVTGSQLGPATVLDAVGAIVKVSDLIVIKYGPLGVLGVSLTLDGAVANPAAAFPVLRFTAEDCFVSTAHTQVVCATSEGVGKLLYTQVSVGQQLSPIFANGTISYSPPTIASFDGAGASNADTRGSEAVVISGDYFGPLGTVIDSATYGLNGNEFVAAGCAVTIAHVQIRCTSALGAGKDHVWLLSIGMQFSIAPTTFYAPPVITDITGPGASDASTDGGQEVVINGNFFAIQKYLDRITYGRSGTEYRPKNCTVLSHSSISCLTAPGTGRKLKWVVTVGGQSSPLSAITTSYAAPSLSLVAPSTGRTIGSSQVATNGAKILAPITLTGKNLASAVLTSIVQVKINAVGLPTPSMAEIQSYYDQVNNGDFPSDSVARWIESLVTLPPSARGRLANNDETLTFSLPEGWGKGRELFILVDGVPSNMLTFDYNSPSLLNVAPDRVGVPPGFLRVFLDGDSFCSGRDGCGLVFVDGTQYSPLNYSHTQISFVVPQPSSSTPAKASICWRASNGKPQLCSQELSFKSPVPNFNGLVGQSGWTEMRTTGGEDFYINGVRDCGNVPVEQMGIYFADTNGRRWDCGAVTRTPQGDVCPQGLDPTSPAFESCRVYKLSCKTPPGVGAKLFIYIHVPGGDSRADEGFTFSYATPTFDSLRLTQGGFPTTAVNITKTDGGAFLINSSGKLAVGSPPLFANPSLTLPNVPFFGSLGAVPTLGGVLAMTGMNLGSARMDPIIRLTTPDGLPGDLTVIGHNHTAMIAALPAGDGANRKLLLTVGFQDSNVFTFNYAAPTVSSVSPPRGPTTGGTMLLIKGANFGVSLPVIRIGGIICPLSSRFAPTPSQPFFRPSPGHDELECILPPGSGAGLPIVVTVNGQSSPVAGAVVKFEYQASHVASIWPVNGPTSGRFPAPPAPAITGAVSGSLAANLAVRLAAASITPGDRVNVTLRGNNLGVSGTIRLLADPELYGSDPLAPPAQVVPDSNIFFWNDTMIVFGLPAGYGFNLSVNVATPKIGAPFSQPGTSDSLFSYNAPTIAAVVHAEFASKEDSCQRSWKKVKVYEDVMRRNSTTRYAWSYPRCFPNKGGEKIMIVGDSLGMGGATGADGGSGVTVTIGGKPCPIIKATGADAGFASSDNKIFCMLPAGSGYDLPVIATVGSRSSIPTPVQTKARRLAFETSSNPVAPVENYPSSPDLLSYDPSFIDEIAPNAFTLGTPGKGLSLRGYNFGNEPSNTTLMINELECESPTWINVDRVECTPQIDVVGAKNVSLLIANHNQPAIRFDVEEKLIFLCRYAFYGMEGEECLPCPTGASCPGEERFKDMVNSTAGFWRTNMSVFSETASQFCEAPRLTTRVEWGCPILQPCEPTDSCLGNNTCAYGYEGERCAFCLRGKFHRVNGECIKCPGNLVVLYLGLAFVLIMAISGAYWLNKKKISLALVAIGVDYFQVVSMFGRAKIKWPPELRELLHVLSIFNLNIDIVAPECLNPGLSYHMKWFFIEALPLIIVGAFLIISIGKILYKLAFTSKRKSQLTAHLPTLVSTSIVVMRLMFLFLCMTAIQAMSCLPTNPIEYRDKSDPKNPRDPVLYMNGLLEYECWKPGGWHLVLFPIGLGLFILWGVVLPVSGFWWLRKNREIVTYDQVLRVKGQGDDELSNPHYRWRKTWSKLYVNFRPENYYWEFIITGRKFLIALVALLFRQAASYQLAMSLLVLFTAFVLHTQHLPYLTHRNRSTVLDQHNALVLTADPMRCRIQTSMNEMEKKNTRKRQRQFAFDGLTNAAKQKDLSAMVLLFVFDPNTVESVMLASAILIDLMGVLLDSQWFAGDRLFLHYPEYTAIGIGAVLIIAFSTLFYIFVVVLELLHTLCPHRLNPIVSCLGLCFNKFSKKSMEDAARGKGVLGTVPGGIVGSKRNLGMPDGVVDSSANLTLNPFLLKQQNSRGNGSGEGGEVVGLDQISSIDMPTPMFWKTVQGSYATMQKMVENLNEENRALKKTLDDARGLAATATTSELATTKTRNVFKSRLATDESEGPAGFVAAGAGAAASLKGFNKLASTRKMAGSNRNMLAPTRFNGAELLPSDDDSRSTTTVGGASLRSGALSPGSVASVGRQWHAADQVNHYAYKDETALQNPMMAAAPLANNPLTLQQ